MLFCTHRTFAVSELSANGWIAVECAECRQQVAAINPMLGGELLSVEVEFDPRRMDIYEAVFDSNKEDVRAFVDKYGGRLSKMIAPSGVGH